MRVLEIGGSTAHDRGVDRGRQVGGVVRTHWPVYLDLFAIAGWSQAEVREHALGVRAAVGVHQHRQTT